MSTPCTPPSFRRTPIRPLLTLGILLAAASQVFPACVMKFETSTGERPKELFVFENPHLRVEFLRGTFWTIGQIFFDQKLVGQASGGTGTVLHWDGKPVGSVHRDKDISEKLISVELIVDGKSFPLVTDGQSGVDPNATWEGRQVTLIKTSVIGPLLHKATFDLSENAPSIAIRHDYEVQEEITPERFTGYRYAFMHMMPIHMSEWMARTSTGAILSGSTAGFEGTNPKVIWQQSIRGLVCYSPTEKIGVSYVFPEAYSGESHYAFRPGKDVKFRAILFDREHYSKGEKLSWSMTLTPFAAPSDTWQKTAESLLGS